MIIIILTKNWTKGNPRHPHCRVSQGNWTKGNPLHPHAVCQAKCCAALRVQKVKRFEDLRSESPPPQGPTTDEDQLSLFFFFYSPVQAFVVGVKKVQKKSG